MLETIKLRSVRTWVAKIKIGTTIPRVVFRSRSNHSASVVAHLTLLASWLDSSVIIPMIYGASDLDIVPVRWALQLVTSTTAVLKGTLNLHGTIWRIGGNSVFRHIRHDIRIVPRIDGGRQVIVGMSLNGIWRLGKDTILNKTILLSSQFVLI